MLSKYLKCSVWTLAVRYDIYIYKYTYIYMSLSAKGLTNFIGETYEDNKTFIMIVRHFVCSPL